MNIAIVCFTGDLASMTIKSSLISSFRVTDLFFDSNPVFKTNLSNDLYLLTTDSESIYYDDLDLKLTTQTNISFDLIIFATKHQSKSGVQSLSCHAPGNWSSAEYGGKDNYICISSPKLLKELYLSLKHFNNLESTDFEVILECTHHGPSINTPCAFIEIGSNEESWANSVAGDVLAQTILHVLSDFTFETNEDIALGFGGLHHAPEFAKRLERNECLVSHVCPKYMLDSVSLSSIECAIQNSVPPVNFILLDWKGLGKNKEKISALCANLGLPIRKTKEFKQIG